MTTLLLAGLTYSNEILFQGFIDGMIYALVALGIVLIYRATGVINFAQGAIGAFGGFSLAILMVNYDLPYWFAAILAIAASAAVSTITELLVVRRLFSKPRLLLFVATLGVSQLVTLLQLWLPNVDERVEYPHTHRRQLAPRRHQRVVARLPGHGAHRGAHTGHPLGHLVAAHQIRPCREVSRRQP